MRPEHYLNYGYTPTCQAALERLAGCRRSRDVTTKRSEIYPKERLMALPMI
ncbi:MAG: hypothetical protein ISS57_11540 [Anaerolineales bacterium]|nr:hypothetical protein [Anaerolineales bacterium]